MNKKTILLVFGTRPEAIKMAPIYHELKKDNQYITLVCVTAQHREMLDQVLDLFDIESDYDLNIMKTGQDLFDITSLILTKIKNVFTKAKPDLVMVHGDTTTSFATSLACFYMDIPVAHIEAGLRTYKLRSPFPEEFNRQITSKISSLHFAPTIESKENLLRELIDDEKIFVTGNTVIDSLFLALSKIENNEDRKINTISAIDDLLKFSWQHEKYILITGHRRENFGSGFEEICEAIRLLAHKYTNVHFVYPVHLNPNVQEPVNKILSGLKNVHLIKPLNYELFIVLLKESYIIITDSGGIQEEAPSLGVPVLVTRDDTERPEAVKAGTVKLVGSKKMNIYENVCELLEQKDKYNKMSFSHNPYGDGTAAQKIVKIIGKLDDY
tara:strand:- start:9854 stop:11002 length:1149 start_codon:yes stop_codon:yes gene_type:complete